MSSPNPSPPAFRDAVAWTPVPLGLVAASGPDAVRFVNNFTTAAIADLPAGGGCEGFFTDARGWVMALATLLRTDDGLLLATDPTRAAPLREHLEHYLIRERVELRDVSAITAAALVAGPGAGRRLAPLCDTPLPTESAGHVRCRIGSLAARVVRVAGQGADGYRIEAAVDEAEALAAILMAAGLPRGDLAAVEYLRIEDAFPAAADIPAKTLPQELGRDSRAISFTKGCYLGQETVARLDALGHVNRRLTVLAIDGPPPALPAAIHGDGEPVGLLTSACPAPLVGGWLGLGLMSLRALAGAAIDIGGRRARPWDRGRNTANRGTGDDQT